MAKLLLESPQQAEKKAYSLGGQRVLLGRGVTNQIVVEDKSVSRVHAQIEPFNGRHRIKDLSSTNGVFINGKRISEAELHHRDQLRIGNALFVYLEKDEPATLSEISIPMFAIRDMENIQEDFHHAKDQEESLLTAFYRLSQVLAQDKNFKDVLIEALLSVLDIVNADTGMVFLSQTEKGVLEPFLAVHQKESVPFDQLAYSRTLLRKAFETGEAILIANAVDDRRLEGAPSVIASSIHNAMCVPLRTPRNTFGVIQVDARSPGRTFTKVHLEVLGVMAKQFAVYLENIKLRKDLQTAQQKLDGMERMRAKFVTTLGYQIATPITVIDQCCHLLKEELLGAVDPKQKEALEVLARHSERLKYIVRDLERVTSWDVLWKKMRDIVEEFDVCKCVEEVLQDVLPLFKMKEQEFVWNSGVRPVLFKGNRQSIQEVLAHLLINSYKFTPDRSTIKLEIQDGGDEIRIVVEDDGLGISPDILGDVFERFYVGDEKLAFAQTAPRFLSRSLGLGLFICKKIVEGHGGKIWVESEMGKFSRFHVHLPHKTKGMVA